MELSELKNKKIAIVGYGLEGRALVEYLKPQGLDISVLEKNPSADLRGDVPRFCGEGYLDHLEDYEIIFRSPGVSYFHPRLRAAARAGAQISSLTELFFNRCPAPIIGVTGTKGKGTTASMIYEMLTHAGKEVFLGGNIGVTPLDFLSQLSPRSYVVLELSSFQLQGLSKSPAIAVITNITADHLDYHATIEEYRAAKALIVRHQGRGDRCVLNADDEQSQQLARQTPAKKYWFSLSAVTEPGAFCLEDKLIMNMNGEETLLCKTSEIKLLGRHNIQNLLAASIAARSGGADLESIRFVATHFSGFAHHHLELVATVQGVAYYNDSAATQPDATLAALAALKPPKILIVGGSDKKADYTVLVTGILKHRVRGVVLLGKTGATVGKLLQAQRYPGKIIESVDMPNAVLAAQKLARRGDSVLLSPASASFGLFKNAKDRGQAFITAVQSLDTPHVIPAKAGI